MAGLGRRSHYRKHLTDSVLNDLPEPTNSNQRIAKVTGTRGSNQFELVVAPPTTIQHDGDEKIIPPPELDMTPQLSILPTKYRKLIWLKRNDYVICECAEEEGDDDHGANNRDDDGKDYDSSKNISAKNTKSIEGGIRFMITHILYKDQIKHLKEKKLWPVHSFFSTGAVHSHNGATQGGNFMDDEKMKSENGACIDKAKELMMKDQNHRDHNEADDEHDDSNHDDELIDDEDEHEEEYGYADDGIIFSNDNDYFVNTNRIAKMKIEDSSSDEDSD